MNNRFEQALRDVKPAQWQPFENLCDQFLVDDYPDFRSTATVSGDGGRDGFILSTQEPTTAFQFSVTADWADKIRKTTRRLKDAHPSINFVIYMTSQEIGAKADDLIKDLRKTGYAVDIRDRSWFLARTNTTPARVKAADWFSDLVLGGLNQTSGLIDHSQSVLTNEELRAALLYLVLQREDDDLDRHLTKLCFDSLVRAVLRDTDPENRLGRAEIYDEIAALLPTQERDEIEMYTGLALTRLERRAIRWHQKDDEYCLTYQERERLKGAISDLQLVDSRYEDELVEHLEYVASSLGVDITLIGDVQPLVTRVRRVLERFLFERGERFTEAIRTGQQMAFTEDEIAELAKDDLVRHPDNSSLRASLPQVVAETVYRAVLSPSETAQPFLRAIGDAYTLLAFLQETPNVQAGIDKLFSQGEFWIDTSAVLPLLAEELLEPHERNYTKLLRAVTEAGAQLYVTEGVLNEVLAHLDNSVYAFRLREKWRGSTPFILSSYLISGREPSQYPSWVEIFRGRARPMLDLAEYFELEHRIKAKNLHAETERVDDAIRVHAQEYWREVHINRRRDRGIDPHVLDQLVKHDVENYVGVIGRRSEGREISNPFGYRSWWIAVDQFAFGAAEEIGDRANAPIDSPVLSFDFLTNYLAVGPARRALDKAKERQLPLLMDHSLLNAPPDVLMEKAEELREEWSGLPERVIRRKVRDHLEAEKLRGDGQVQRRSMQALQDDITEALRTGAGG